MKKTAKKTIEKTAPKKAKNANPLVELINRKKEAQESGATAFGKFKRGKERNENNSNVGPSWGKRKGN